MSLKVVQISDSHCYLDDEQHLLWAANFKKIYTNKNLKQVVSHIKNNSTEYDLCIFTGDLVEEEICEAYLHVSKILSDLKFPYFVLPGNHDNVELMKEVFSKKFLATINSAEWKFILIDTHVDDQAYGEISDSEFARLEKELSQVKENEFVAIFMHHHPVSVNCEWIDNMCLKNSEKFWKTLAKFNQIKAVFHGHIHQAFHSEKILSGNNVIKIYGSPATSIQGKPLSKNVEFAENGPGIREIVFHDNGEIETYVFYI